MEDWTMDDTEVVRMYQGGMSSADIALEMGVSAAAVRDVLEKAGLMLKAGRKSAADGIDPEQRAELINKYLNEKIPAIQLTQEYELSWNAFYKILNEEQVPFRAMKQEDRIAREQRLDRAVAMYQGNARIWEIENETGIRQPVLHATLHRRGIPLRRGTNLSGGK
jgi:hypothetical protein